MNHNHSHNRTPDTSFTSARWRAAEAYVLVIECRTCRTCDTPHRAPVDVFVRFRDSRGRTWLTRRRETQLPHGVRLNTEVREVSAPCAMCESCFEAQHGQPGPEAQLPLPFEDTPPPTVYIFDAKTHAPRPVSAPAPKPACTRTRTSTLTLEDF